MSRYATLSTAAKTLLQSLTIFAGHPEQVTEADDRILDMGVDQAIILYPGMVGEEVDEQDRSYRSYTMVLELFVRLSSTDTAAFAALVALRDSVIQLEEEYPHLTLADALESTIRADEDPAWVFDTASTGPTFLMQTLRWEVYRLTPLIGGLFA